MITIIIIIIMMMMMMMISKVTIKCSPWIFITIIFCGEHIREYFIESARIQSLITRVWEYDVLYSMNEWVQKMSQFYDTKRWVNKSHTKHFPWLFLFIIYISRFPFQLCPIKFLIMLCLIVFFVSIKHKKYKNKHNL